MPTNLVSTIMQSLSSEAIEKMASNLGLNDAAIRQATSAAVPAVLGGLARIASAPDGAQRVHSAVSKMMDASPTDMMHNWMQTDSRSLADTGWSALASLLGSQTADALSSAVARFAGFGQTASKGLLGMLAPVVLGVLRSEQIDSGLDARGLANMLAGQRGMIERAMPAGFATSVESRDSAAPWRAPQRARPPAYEPVRATSSRSWGYWLLPALVLAAAAIYFLPADDATRTAHEINQNTQTGAQQTGAKDNARLAPPPQAELKPAPVATTPPNEQAVTAGTLENDIIATIGRLRTTLQTMKDSASSQTALADLKDISGQFGRLRAAAQRLTPEARKALAAAVASKVPDLNALLDRIGAESNTVGAEAKPAMDTLRSDLTGLSKA